MVYNCFYTLSESREGNYHKGRWMLIQKEKYGMVSGVCEAEMLKGIKWYTSAFMRHVRARKVITTEMDLSNNNLHMEKVLIGVIIKGVYAY